MSFDKFTDKGRKVLVLAQEEARKLDQSYVGTEHLLLGLIREGDGIAAHALANLNVTYEAALEQIEAVPGIPAQVAREVYDTLRAWDAELERGRDDADVSRSDAPTAPAKKDPAEKG